MPHEVWPIEWPSKFNIDDYEPQKVQIASELAINTLRTLTLNRVGQAHVLARPSCQGGFSTYEVYSQHHRNFYPAADLLRSSYSYRHFWGNGTIRLVAPVSEIIDVRVSGVSLPAESYQVVDGGYLKLIGAVLTAHDLEVEYIVGYPVSLAGRYAAGLLAMEFLKGMSDPGGCVLPKGVTEITRQGISMTIESDLFPGGLTNISEVDAFIYQWNPHGLKTKPTVHSPDLNGRIGSGDRW